VFVQFIDCVYQLLQQFPTQFEWNEAFLITILDHLYSCRFGTFLFNSEKERIDNSVKTKSQTLWILINSNLSEYQNPFFMPSLGVLIPLASMEDMHFWTGYYLRWKRQTRRILTVELRGQLFQNTINSHLERLKALEKEIEQLRLEKEESLKQSHDKSGRIKKMKSICSVIPE